MFFSDPDPTFQIISDPDHLRIRIIYGSGSDYGFGLILMKDEKAKFFYNAADLIFF